MGVMDSGAFKARADKSAGEKMPFLAAVKRINSPKDFTLIEKDFAPC